MGSNKFKFFEETISFYLILPKLPWLSIGDALRFGSLFIVIVVGNVVGNVVNDNDHY